MSQILFSFITFLAVLMNFTFLFSFFPSSHSGYYQSSPPFLHLSAPYSISLFLPPSPSFSVFPGNCFMALLVAVGWLPQVYGPVTSPSSTLRPKRLFLSEFNTINSGMSQTHPIRFSFTSLLSHFEILITFITYLVYYNMAVFFTDQMQKGRTALLLSIPIQDRLQLYLDAIIYMALR